MKAIARRPRLHGIDKMNKMERHWAVILRMDASVRRAEFEGVRLRLADGTYYTPDFFVVKDSGYIEFHETKGHMREAARVRLRVAANLYPEFTFVLITKPKGMWQIEVIPGEGEK